MTSLAVDTLAPFSQRTQVLFKATEFAPTIAQAPILLCPARSLIVTGGEQAGKSLVSAKKLLMEYPNDLLRAMHRAELAHKPRDFHMPLVYWLVGESYDACEREFGYIRDDFETLGWLRPGSYRKINPGTLYILGGEGRDRIMALIHTKSAADYRSLRKEAPSGIIVCEASQLNLTAFERVKARMAPMEAWLIMAGTIEAGNGWYSRTAQQWGIAGPDRAWFRLPSASNYYLYPGGDDDPEIVRMRNESPDAFFKERFEGVPCPPRGVVFPEVQPSLHIGEVVYEPGVAVQLWEDPGYGTDSAHAILAVQVINSQVRVFAESYTQGLTTDLIIDDLRTKHGWWRDVETVLMDPHYATQHHANTSVEEVWRAKCPGLRVVVPKRQHVRPRLERIKSFLVPTATGGARLVVDTECRGLLSEFGLCSNPFDGQDHPYRWRTDRDGNTIGEEPEDRWNHSCEALGRGLMHNFGAVGTLRKRTFRSQFFDRVPRKKRRRAGSND